MTINEFYDKLSEVADEWPFQIFPNGTLRTIGSVKHRCECPIVAVANYQLDPNTKYWNGDPESAVRDINLDTAFAEKIIYAADEADVVYDVEIRKKLLTAVGLQNA